MKKITKYLLVTVLFLYQSMGFSMEENGKECTTSEKGSEFEILDLRLPFSDEQLKAMSDLGPFNLPFKKEEEKTCKLLNDWPPSGGSCQSVCRVAPVDSCEFNRQIYNEFNKNIETLLGETGKGEDQSSNHLEILKEYGLLSTFFVCPSGSFGSTEQIRCLSNKQLIDLLTKLGFDQEYQNLGKFSRSKLVQMLTEWHSSCNA